MLVNNTPLETHRIHGVPIIVKREDLCAPLPGPMFSKMRGVVAHIEKREEKVIGVLDTYHSKAGWCVAYVCQQLGKTCVNYWPRYNADPKEGLPREQQQRARDLGAKMQAIKAGRSAILYHAAKKHLKEATDGGGYLMPNALKLPESITENAAEVVRTAPDLPVLGTLIISISSGTVAAGVVKGFHEAGLLDAYDVVLHMGYSRSQDAVRAYLDAQTGLTLGSKVRLVDEGYSYGDAVNLNWCKENIPFPCNPYYDAKLVKWLHNTTELEQLAARGPIVLWNIGA